MVDYDSITATKSKTDSATKGSEGSSGYVVSNSGVAANQNSPSDNQDKDDVFSDSEDEETKSTKIRQARPTSEAGGAAPDSKSGTMTEQVKTLTGGTEQISLVSNEPKQINSGNQPSYNAVAQSESGLDSAGLSDIKAMAADASVFTFGDDEDYESE